MSSLYKDTILVVQAAYHDDSREKEYPSVPVLRGFLFEGVPSDLSKKNEKKLKPLRIESVIWIG